jgi:hypothetical protein
LTFNLITKAALERLQVSLAFDIEAAHGVLETLRIALSVRYGHSFH